MKQLVVYLLNIDYISQIYSGINTVRSVYADKAYLS